jgi:hypothetical protein
MEKDSYTVGGVIKIWFGNIWKEEKIKWVNY